MGDVRTFEGMIGMWQNRYKTARPLTRISNILQDAEFLQKRPHLENEYGLLLPLSSRYLALVLGRERGVTAVEQAAGASLCFCPRILGVPTVDDLQAPFNGQIAGSLPDTFFLGMACHFVLHNQASRSKLNNVDMQALFARYLRESIAAEGKMSAYNKATHNIPRDTFNIQYNLIEPTYKKGLHVGFWKLGKVRSNHYNVFCSGILLPMMAEIMASET